MVIRPASPRRAWMDRTNGGFAYRCLPLTIANSHGWEVLSPSTFEATWTGGYTRDAVQFTRLDDGDGPLPDSQFGEGIITFQLGYLFRTEPGYNMYVTGPVNVRRDGIVPLSAVVETDWLPFPFTMNWAFTRSGVPIRFDKGEPFCHIFPVAKSLLEETQPEIRGIETNPDLHAELVAWHQSRQAFLQDLQRPGSDALKEGWQRFYNRGHAPTGLTADSAHQTKLTVRPFELLEGNGADTSETKQHA